jgi:hypothetical protein
LALLEKPTWAIPVTTRGYAMPVSTVNTTITRSAGTSWRRTYFTPSAVMSRSMSLIPMKGATTPPAP